MMLVAAMWGGLLACSASETPIDETPTLDRIDGPAVVDPDFDPFATVASAPSTTARG